MAKPKSIKEYYKIFGLRFDVREARKYLGLNNTYTKREVNKELKKLYDFIFAEEHQVYSYTFTGETRRVTTETTKDKETKSKQTITKLTEPQPISMTFQSKTKYKFKKANFHYDLDFNDYMVQQLRKANKLPIINIGGDNWPEFLGDNWDIATEWMQKGHSGSLSYVVNTILNISRRKMSDTHKSLKNVPLYSSSINLPYKEFNGFKDSGNLMCVPETIYHHLTLKGKNKKLTFDKLIEEFEKLYPQEEEDGDLIYYFYEDPETGEFEPVDDDFGERGYTAEDIICILEKYGVRGRLLDINCKQFLTTNMNLKCNDNLPVFVAIVYNNHLYYCDNKDFVKSIGDKNRLIDNGFCDAIYEKKIKASDKKLEVIDAFNLQSYYIDTFNTDKTIRLVNTDMGRITKIIYDDKIVVANPDKEIMTEILGDKFANENLTILGNKLFKEFYPKHQTSHFTKDVFDKLEKHGNIVKSFNTPIYDIQDEYDINKCRTHCWMSNKLGNYEVFTPDSQVEEYNGKIEEGLYYVEVLDADAMEFFMRGSTWYSGNFVKYGLKTPHKNIKIKYQLLASSTLDKDYFKPFVEHIIKQYPKHFKHILNPCIGYRGQTNKKERKGYIETDYDMAVNAFWDNNDEKVGFLADNHIDKTLWKIMKGKLCNIQTIKINDDTEHYLVETVSHKTLYQNDLPIYNKVLENEYLNLYLLKQKLQGRIIKIKTDAIVVEGKHNKIELNDEIGGYKHQKIKVKDVIVKELIIEKSYNLDLSMNWNIFEEKEDYSVDLPNGSFLVTGLAGYGKSHFVKNLPDYDKETTLRLGFTNVSVENIEDTTHQANTLNSYFGINFNTRKCSEKKMKNLKNIKTIIITEVFMTPSYIMGHLSQIKHEFPDIKFICEGDPEQLRPVKEEHINWLEKHLLFNLCDGNLVKLLYNKRNDETKNYTKIFNNIPLDKSKYSAREPQNINLTKTNKLRVSINHEKMDKEGYFISKTKKNKYSQDIRIKLDTPIMCIKSNKKFEIKNGKMYNIEAINQNNILVNQTEFTDALFAEYFVVAYAMTNHKVQGITIKEPYNIYEWKNMIKREKYTAYSRTGNADYVKIIPEYKANEDLWADLQKFFSTNYIVYKWSSLNNNNIYIGITNDLNKRKEEHIKSCNDEQNKYHNLYVYQYMRDNGGIENWNMDIVEEFYAEDIRDAEKKEQYYINILKPSLNSINSYNATD